MNRHICLTCCAEFAPSELVPERCPICADPRQYIKREGQKWTSESEIAASHKSDLREEEPGLLGVGVTPTIGIGQRALLIEDENGGVLWDGVPLIDDAGIKEIKRRGGVRAMAMSHPHLYGAMVTNSEKLGDVPIYIPEKDRQWVMHPHKNIRYFSEDALDLGNGVSLHVTGGHFEGSSLLHWRQGANGKGVLLSGDTMLVAADRDWVSFMWSTPNMVQLHPKAIRKIVSTAERLDYDRLYAGWWDAYVADNAKRKVALSEERILQTLGLN